jgi:hypothetical protein
VEFESFASAWFVQKELKPPRFPSYLRSLFTLDAVKHASIAGA